MRRFVLFALSILFSIHLLAQDSSLLLQNVVVFSQRLEIPVKSQNHSIVIIQAQELKRFSGRSVNDILSYVAGVDVRQRGPQGTQADIGIDGGGFDQVLILVNGIQVTDPQTGHNTMNIPVPVDALERVEVLKGPAARIYGVNAMTGVINFVTKKLYQNAWSIHINAGSSFQKDTSTSKLYHNKGIQAFYNAGNKKNQSLFAAGFDNSTGYRYNTAFDNAKLMYAGNYKINERLKIAATLGYTNKKFGANAFYAAPRDAEATEQVQVAIGGLNAEIAISDNWKMKPAIGFRYAKDDYIFTRKNPSLYRNIHETLLSDIGINNTFNNKFGKLGLGLFVRNDKINSTNLGKRNRINKGLFLEQYTTLSAKVNLVVGIFANHNSKYGFKIYPGLDIGYQATDSLRLFINIGSGQRLPTYTDLYYKGPGNIGNEFLQPETSMSYEAGSSMLLKKAGITSSIFYRNGSGFIDWVRANDTQPWQPQNFTKVNTFGINTQIKNQWINTNILSLSSKIGYTFLSPKVSGTVNQSQSKYTINALRHQLVVQANLSIRNRWNLFFGNSYCYRINASEVNDGYKRKSYSIFDAAIQLRSSKLVYSASANNLFNVKFIESGVVPLPGRWVSVGVAFQSPLKD